MAGRGSSVAAEWHNHSMWWSILVMAALVGQPPAPKPFPRPGGATAPKPATPATPAKPDASKPPPTSTAAPAPAPPVDGPPTAEFLGVPIYPGAQYLTSYDAGRGQRFYLFGSTASFLDLVTYYRKQLGRNGDLVFDAPATYEFLVGRFREETMAFPPGVTIKEFKSAISEGYPNPKAGAQPARFPTVIQIVPVTEK
jgi:hypothetical protein